MLINRPTWKKFVELHEDPFFAPFDSNFVVASLRMRTSLSGTNGVRMDARNVHGALAEER